MHIKYKKLKLITFGCGNKYDDTKFNPIKNNSSNKPKGGLWTSPIDSEYGWKQWCIDENFGDLSTDFNLIFDGRVFIINSKKDMLKMPTIKFKDLPYNFIDFEKIVEMGIDAIHLTVRGELATKYCFSEKFILGLYGWDCETVLILNKNCIK